MRPSWCRWGSRWCCSADPLQGFPLLSFSGWITVSHWHAYISAHIILGHKNFTTNKTMPGKQGRRPLMENRPNGCPETIYWPQKRKVLYLVELNKTRFLHNDISFLFSCLTLCLCVLQISRSYRWTNECPRLWMETCTFQMFSQKTAGQTTSAMLASLTLKPSSRNSLSQLPCSTVSQRAKYDYSQQSSRT